MEIRVDHVPLSVVRSQLRDRIINDNNHSHLDWTYGKILSEDEYLGYYNASRRSHYFHVLPADIQNGTIQIPLSNQMCRILAKASLSASMTGRKPGAFEEELDEIAAYINLFISKLSGKWFIRLEECSPKDGTGRNCGPYDSPVSSQDIVLSLITSRRCHTAFTNCDSNILYVTPWQDHWAASGIEWRVFVHHGRVTAISQYSPCDVCDIFDLESLAKTQIVPFVENTVVPAMGAHNEFVDSNWVVDVVTFGGNKTELVELNPFGAELSSGASLFSWIRDRPLLYNDSFVTVRVAVSDV